VRGMGLRLIPGARKRVQIRPPISPRALPHEHPSQNKTLPDPVACLTERSPPRSVVNQALIRFLTDLTGGLRGSGDFLQLASEPRSDHPETGSGWKYLHGHHADCSGSP
jgi:hypothetical protein